MLTPLPHHSSSPSVSFITITNILVALISAAKSNIFPKPLIRGCAPRATSTRRTCFLPQQLRSRNSATHLSRSPRRKVIPSAIADSFDTTRTDIGRGQFSIQKKASFLPPATVVCRNKSDVVGAMDKSSPTTPTASTEAQAVTAMSLLRQQKQALRKLIRSRIKATYPPADPERLIAQSDLVFSRLFALPQYRAAESIGFFLSMPAGEIQTRNALRQIVEDGKALFVPRVGLDFEKCEMDLVRCDTSAVGEAGLFYDGWPRNKWGIPEPPVASSTAAARSGDIDLLIVPGLSFDRRGHRLGQGKGYYDRFIARMRTSAEPAKPVLVGMCLEEQYLEEAPPGVAASGGQDGAGVIIPISKHDYIMDMVLTPSRTLAVPRVAI